MPTVTSTDGTTIVYERTGTGPALVLVDGAMCHRAAGPMRPLATLLQEHFTVYAYDRRGRGESGDTRPYSIAREIEDLGAVISAAGGEIYAYSMSSGGALTLAAAAADARIAGLVLYEPPFIAEFVPGAAGKEYTERLDELLGEGRNGDAVALFMTYVGVPAVVVDGMRSGPGWAAAEAIAPTLAYDDALLAGGGVPRDVTPAVTVPALVVAGGAGPQSLQQAARATAEALPAGQLRILEGQTHDVDPAALAPVMVEFLTA